MTTSLTRIWRNWPVHNIIAHPLSEILQLLGLQRWSIAVHDGTVPVDSSPPLLQADAPPEATETRSPAEDADTDTEALDEESRENSLAELLAAAASLGLTDRVFAGFQDGALACILMDSRVQGDDEETTWAELTYVTMH